MITFHIIFLDSRAFISCCAVCCCAGATFWSEIVVFYSNSRRRQCSCSAAFWPQLRVSFGCKVFTHRHEIFRRNRGTFSKASWRCARRRNCAFRQVAFGHKFMRVSFWRFERRLRILRFAKWFFGQTVVGVVPPQCRYAPANNTSTPTATSTMYSASHYRSW